MAERVQFGGKRSTAHGCPRVFEVSKRALRDGEAGEPTTYRNSSAPHRCGKLYDKVGWLTEPV